MKLRRWHVAIRVLTSASLTALASSARADFGDPLPSATAAERLAFEAGAEEFSEVEDEDEGLGPVFNEASCASCHNQPELGGGSVRLETRFGRLDPQGRFDPMEDRGGSLLQDHSVGKLGGGPGCNYKPERVPGNAKVRALRRSTPLFGLGLVDAVPDSAFQALAAAQRASTPAIAGVVSIVPDLATGRDAVGKFGWKAQNPSLFQFSGDAYVNELGITNPQFPDENCPQGNCDRLACNPVPELNDDGTGVAGFTDFMTFLAPPPRGPITDAVLGGEREFEQAGCGGCHVSTLRTGSNASPALDRVEFHPYSDFLLHDMGKLGDGITQNRATGRLMRTAPLWGLREIETFLHDGRAATVKDAILAHDGQGAAAREAFARLPAARQNQLLLFLNSL